MKRSTVVFIALIVITPAILGYILSEFYDKGQNGPGDERTIDGHDDTGEVTRITKYVIWNADKSPISIDSDLVLDKNTQLNISSGVEIEMNGGNLEVEGNVIALGTGTRPIIFNGKGNELSLDSTEPTNSSFEFCIFRYVDLKIIDKNVSISHTRIENSSIFYSESNNDFLNNNVCNTRIDLMGGRHRIQNNTYTRCNYDTTTRVALGMIDIRDNMFIDCSIGFAFVDGYIYSNIFVNKNAHGEVNAVELYWSQVVISKNEINGYATGIRCEGNTSVVEILENDIEDSITGIEIINNKDRLIISRNHLRGLDTAIDIFMGVSKMNVEITRNIISDCSTGIIFADYLRTTDENRIISSINNNSINTINFGIELTDTSVELKNNNISQINNESIFISCGPNNFANSTVYVNQNIISGIRLLCELHGVEKNFSYNYWTNGEVVFWCLNKDISDWFYPVLTTKPEVDLA